MQDPGCFNFADIVPRDCKQYEEQEQTQEQQQEQQQEEDHKDQGPKFTPPEGYEGIGLIDYSNIINHRWQHDQDSKYPSTGSQEPGGNEKEDGGYVEEDEGADRTWEMPEQQHEQQRLKGDYASREPKQQQQRKDGYTRKEPEQQQQQQQQRHKDGHARREPEQQEQQQQRKDGGGSKGGDGYHKQQRDTKQYPKVRVWQKYAVPQHAAYQVVYQGMRVAQRAAARLRSARTALSRKCPGGWSISRVHGSSSSCSRGRHRVHPTNCSTPHSSGMARPDALVHLTSRT